MSIKKKIVWLPYDFDTAIGINNEGELVFGYELEDIDHLSGGADVYNGQNSVIWNNIRLAFAEELRSMYQQLRSKGKLSYEAIEKAFEEHQSKWPEALFNEDSQFCYLDPLINSGTNYLEMLQGSKEEQRKWWLYNRFRYIDSKYNAGDALSDLIQLRSYAKSDITITPYADIYPAVKFGSYLVTKRGQRNVATLLECPVDALNDTETYIYSASQLASVGDLSGLKVGFADFSMATKLQSLKLGDASSSYENQNLKVLTLGNNVLLQTIDVRNCTALGSGDMKVVDISGCTGIQKAWFDNTKITALTLPIGGVLDTLSLPATITNLTIRNQPKLTSFTLAGNNYGNISTCRIENTDYFLKNQTRLTTLLNGLPDRSRLRLVGLDIDWLADTTAINTWYDSLDRFRGLDINGENLDNAYVEGVIHIDSAKGSDIAALLARYPYMRIDATHTESYIYYYNGATLITSEKILDGGDGTYTGTTPTKSQDAQYTYTFAGWSKDDDNTVDSDALTNVVADRNVYACFTGTLRKYTVTFVRSSTDGGGTLQTIQNVTYGTTITAASAYTGSTPTTTQGSATDYPFEGWEPASATVIGNTTFTAKFGSLIEVKEIADSWDTIIANIDNGTYLTKYKIGNYKPLDLGTEGTINMQIVAMDADELADGSGYAPLTFLGMELLNTKYKFNDSEGMLWENSDIKNYLKSTIFPLIASNVRSRINSRKALLVDYDGNQYNVVDDLWIPSIFDLVNPQKRYVLFPDDNSRIKKLNNAASTYWVRSVVNDRKHVRTITNTGAISEEVPYRVQAICLGFCLGLEPETITDSWETILANENPSGTYSIGDTKYVDLGTEGKQLMEIVAFDTDDKADGSGKAKITWLSKTLLNSKYKFNNSNKTYNGVTGRCAGGFYRSDLRTYLMETIMPMLPQNVRTAIVPVSKISTIPTSTAWKPDTETVSETIWIPSAIEVGSRQLIVNGGPTDGQNYFPSGSYYDGKTGVTRSAYSNGYTILTGGSNVSGSKESNIVIGFCTD